MNNELVQQLMVYIPSAVAVLTSVVSVVSVISKIKGLIKGSNDISSKLVEKLEKQEEYYKSVIDSMKQDLDVKCRAVEVALEQNEALLEQNELLKKDIKARKRQ